jgi:hypothetical protein
VIDLIWDSVDKSETAPPSKNDLHNDGVLAPLHRDLYRFTREFDMTATVKSYEDELVSKTLAATVDQFERT